MLFLVTSTPCSILGAAAGMLLTIKHEAKAWLVLWQHVQAYAVHAACSGTEQARQVRYAGWAALSGLPSRASQPLSLAGRSLPYPRGRRASPLPSPIGCRGGGRAAVRLEPGRACWLLLLGGPLRQGGGESTYLRIRRQEPSEHPPQGQAYRARYLGVCKQDGIKSALAAHDGRRHERRTKSACFGDRVRFRHVRRDRRRPL